MPLKPKHFFSSKGHGDDRERLFCLDEDGLLWVLSTPSVHHKEHGESRYVWSTPDQWLWCRVSLQTENEAADAKKHGPKEQPLR